MHSVLLTLGICLAVTDSYNNLALHKQRQQSTTHFSYGAASFGNDGNRNNVDDYTSNSCIHTDGHSYHEEAWWRVDLGFISRIHEINITYRQGYAGRFNGFSIFVSNTSDFKTGIRCFKHSGSVPDVETTPYRCTGIGQYVTVYNDRFRNTYYGPNYNTDGAVLELCEVEVSGCNPQRYGYSCENSCFCKGITCDYKTGQCDGDCQPGYTGEACNTPCVPGYFGNNCLSQCPQCGGDKTCNQSGVCTNGCEAGYFPGQSPGCPKTCGRCVGVVCNVDGTCSNGCIGGYYLSTCNDSCPRNCDTNNCEQNSGNCSSCKDGYYGSTCDQKCPDNCLNEKCNMKTGQCIACDPGYYGDQCWIPCPHCGGNKTCNQYGVCLDGCEVGFYPNHSPGCSKQCGNCFGIRCNMDGSCPEECVNGYYTSNCTRACSDNCYNGLCYKESGRCILCSEGYYMSYCTAKCPSKCYKGKCDKESGKCTSCEDGYYGEVCDNQCPEYCLQRKCDFISGQCLGCEPEHYGHNCTNECLHCGGNKTCNDFGVCIDGCETGFASDHYPGCRLKRENDDAEMTNLTLPLAVGISGGVFLVLIGTVLNIFWNRRKRAHTGTRSQIYMASDEEHPTEHVYSDLQPGIKNTNLVLDEELVDFQSGDTYQNTKDSSVKSESSFNNLD